MRFAKIVFLFKGGQGGNADDVAFHDHAELVHSEHQVHHLIPRNRLVKGQGNFTADILVDGKVFSADFPKNPEDILDIGLKEIQCDFLAGVLFDIFLQNHGLVGVKCHLGERN